MKKILLCGILIVILSSCIGVPSPPPPPRPFEGFPKGYESWRTYFDKLETDNGEEFSLDFFFLNDRISKISTLHMIMPSNIIKSIRNKNIDYTKNVAFFIEVISNCDDYNLEKEILKNCRLQTQNSGYVLSNYANNKHSKKIFIYGFFPKEMFIEISKSKRLSLEFKFKDKKYNIDINVPKVYDDTFTVYNPEIRGNNP